MNEYYIKQYNISMRYQDFPGNECPILFIHGLGCAGSFDYPQVATQNKLKKHRCIIVDLLGAGYSDKPSDFEYSVSAHASYLKNFVDDLEFLGARTLVQKVFQLGRKRIVIAEGGRGFPDAEDPNFIGGKRGLVGHVLAGMKQKTPETQNKLEGNNRNQDTKKD